MNIESIFENFPFLQESEQVTSNYFVEILNFSFHVAYERIGKDYVSFVKSLKKSGKKLPFMLEHNHNWKKEIGVCVLL